MFVSVLCENVDFWGISFNKHLAEIILNGQDFHYNIIYYNILLYYIMTHFIRHIFSWHSQFPGHEDTLVLLHLVVADRHKPVVRR